MNVLDSARTTRPFYQASSCFIAARACYKCQREKLQQVATGERKQKASHHGRRSFCSFDEEANDEDQTLNRVWHRERQKVLFYRSTWFRNKRNLRGVPDSSITIIRRSSVTNLMFGRVPTSKA